MSAQINAKTRIWILSFLITAVSFLALSSTSFAEEPPTLSEAQAQPQPEHHHMWEINAAAFKSFSSDDPNQLGAVRMAFRRFLNESLSVGADIRYWPAGSYPLTNDTSAGAWAAGGTGQLYLFRSSYIGAYLGGSLLWVPTNSQAVFAPEVGFKWFASQRLALGLSYWILTDLGSYTTSFEPYPTGRSRQSLGFELSVYL